MENTINTDNKKKLQNNPEYFGAISKLFNNSGIVAPIAEKAYRNFELKRKNGKNKTQRIHYFAIGHAFKQVDTKIVFDYVLDENTKKEEPTKFFALQTNNFDFEEKLFVLLSKIRNINNHYIHRLDEIEINKIDQKNLPFLKESFELAVIQTYFKEKKELPSEHDFVPYLQKMFYPNLNEHRKNITETELLYAKNRNRIADKLKKYKKNEIIDFILFFVVDSDFVWKMNDQHEVLEIKKGKYLTFEACLFLITMFLYKNEANHLIPRIEGFKRADGDEMKSKRYLFSYFSKKFTSQDVDAEETHLVKFRDMIQYLNHYPTVWNKELEPESENNNPSMTQKLEEEIIEMEINRSYPDYKNDNRFLVFAKYHIWGKKHLGKIIEKEYINYEFTPKEIEEYNDEITQDPHIKIYKNEIEKSVKPIAFNPKEDLYKIFVKQYVLKTYFPTKYGYDAFRNHKFEFDKKSMKMADDGYQEKLMTNQKTEKLKLRIAKNLLIKSYGRNQDRFMDFSMRFLAEKKYFGTDAQFKCYQFYNTIEQDDFLEKFKATATKKEIDALKYHRGRLVHFVTYENQIVNYPEYEFPFVEENNAMAIRIVLNNELKVIPIQRALMIYFLEHCLYQNKSQGRGLNLLKGYHIHHSNDFNLKLDAIKNESINETDKKEDFKKLLPRRLLHQSGFPIGKQVGMPERNSLELILDKVIRQEKRYADLLQKTKDTEQKYKSTHREESITLVEDFLKRNKGKQFKLQFIRKVCHLMFFKETYNAQIGYDGHHKRFHITRDEFNNFSRWMFAYAGNDSYKKYLNELFENKGFFLNTDFKRIFNDSQDLNSLYEKVKKEYAKWLVKPTTIINKDRYKLENYSRLFNNNIFYINLSHFIIYLKSIGTLKEVDKIIQYKALQNKTYLIDSYYYKEKIEPNEYKTLGKLYNKLNKSALEDALLYEIAFSYLQNQNDMAKANVADVLTQNLVFAINDKEGNHSYNLTVPFNKIDQYVELISNKYSKNSNHILENLQKYLQNTRVIKGKNAQGQKIFMEKDLNFEDLNTINNTIINESLKFMKVLMGLEKYFILKDKTTLLSDKNFIENKDIISLNDFSKVWKIWKDGNNNIEDPNVNFRNIACHFNLPLDKSFETVLKEIERKFIKQEIRLRPKTFEDLDKNIKGVCELFMQNIHGDFYLNLFKKEESKDIKDDKKEKIKRINERYLTQIINKPQY